MVNVYATTITQQSDSPLRRRSVLRPAVRCRTARCSRAGRASPSRSARGVIVDPKGIIVTNSHVVNGATDVKVAVQGGHQYDVDVLINDSKTDLAVLKIKDPAGKTFPTLQFADSDALEVGDLVLAVGNPFGVARR